MKKGTLLVTGNGKKTYQIVGRWDRALVLADVSGNDDQVLIYEPDELQGLVDEKIFVILNEKNQKRGSK